MRGVAPGRDGADDDAFGGRDGEGGGCGGEGGASGEGGEGVKAGEGGEGGADGASVDEGVGEGGGRAAWPVGGGSTSGLATSLLPRISPRVITPRIITPRTPRLLCPTAMGTTGLASGGPRAPTSRNQGFR